MKLKKFLAGLAAATMVATCAIGNSNVILYNNTPVYAASALSTSSNLKESAYMTWAPVSGADGYNVYVDGVQIDSMLVRQYSGYFRADAVGLKAGNHTMKVVPTKSGTEMTAQAFSETVTVDSYDRSGFCFSKSSVTGGSGIGAYNDDGTLKSNAVVLYVTEETKNTVTMDVQTASNKTTACTGISAILKAMQKGFETRPVAIRIIGKVTASGMTGSGDTNNLLLKASATDSPIQNITVEGIGDDATCYGFGIRAQRARNIEIRNLAVMLFGDDGIALETDNYNIWVHNNDIFYGTAGSDADQAKGDGSMDLKDDSKYITISYNHFWDSGKMSLCGMKSETAENWISYHHNWFDHSDSRHPRIRTMSVHVYNNYYDGNSKYGVGTTMGSNAFVESNYFRNCQYPMLISKQGTDALGEGTFSGENGGMIKAYGNIMEGQKSYITYAQNNTQFDAYEVSSKSETVPSSVKTVAGGTSYNNFDTNSSIMYSYTADAAKDIPSIVMNEAGRVDGGDFEWEFNDSVDDESYALNAELMAAIKAYDDEVIAIGSGFDANNDNPTTPEQPVVTTTTTTTTPTTTTTVKTTTTKATTEAVIASDAIYCSPNASSSGAGTKDNPIDVKSALTKIKAGGTIYLLEGTYKFSEQLTIAESNSGTANAMKTIRAYPGADVTFDFSGQGAANSSVRGIVLDGSYWHFYGFEIARAADNGMLLSGDNNLIEMMVFNDNQDTGLQLSRFNTSYATIAEWPSYNTILNCTSKNNCDNATMENADGFAAKLTCGEGNVFDGCIAYNNSDDGWDLYAKTETGPIGVVTIRNSAAFRNGFTEYGEGFGDCDGNGFKLGGAGVGTAHIVENCIAFENLNCGFTDNNNPKLATITNCTAYNNDIDGNGKPNFSCYRCTDDGCDFSEVITYMNGTRLTASFPGGEATYKATNDKFVGTMANSLYYNGGKYYYVTAKTAIDNGSKIGTAVTDVNDDMFVSLDVAAYTKVAAGADSSYDFHTNWRDADGSINTNGFLEVKDSSKYAGLGVDLTDATSTPSTPVVTTVSTTGGGSTTTTKTTVTSVTPTVTVPAGGVVHNFTLNGKDSTFFTITGSLSKDKGTVSYAGLTLTQCLKMESATSITFNTSADGKITLVFLEAGKGVKVDGTKYTTDANGIVTVDLKAGSHTITKGDAINLYYMVYADNGSSSQPSTLKGDVNADGVVNVADASALQKFLAKKSTTVTAAYDVNKDGKINVFDLAIVKRMLF